VEELSEKVRTRATTSGKWLNTAVLKDEENRRIIGTAKFVYDVRSKKFFDYSSTGFRFTSRTLMAEDYSPITVSKLGFVIENAGKKRRTMKVQIKRDKGWEDEEKVTILYDETGRTFLEWPLPQFLAARNFTMRITSMPSDVYIRKILALTDMTSDISSWSQ